MKRKLIVISIMLVVVVAFAFGIFKLRDNTIKASDTKIVVFHYQRSDNTYDNWNVWLWEKDGDEIGESKFAGMDEYGAYAVAECDARMDNLGFSVRYSTDSNPWEKKDYPEDRFVSIKDISQSTVHIYLKSGEAAFSVKGDNQQVIIKAEMYGRDRILFEISEAKKSSIDLKFILRDEKGKQVDVKKVELLDDYKKGFIYVDGGLDMLSEYTINNGVGSIVYVDMCDYYSCEEFKKEYVYEEGNDLGVTLSCNNTKFRVWAPTAESLSLNLYRTGNESKNDLVDSIKMKKDIGGTWLLEVPKNLEGYYYTYTIKYEECFKKYYHEKYKIDVDDPNGYEAMDPYARSAGVNGTKGMIIDVENVSPAGWNRDENHTVSKITDASIYEVSVRDTSTDDYSGIRNKGKFVSFLERGTTTPNGVPTGMDHIKSMGINMVQLMPVYDFASVDESRGLQNDKYNWGYDPANFNVPEGSYSTDPSNGYTRVMELKQMIQEFHSEEIGVVMDVVYNHTYYDFPFGFSVLVPGYFHRPNSNASGCGNDTATERTMVTKYIVDSIVYWAKEYHLDGFRFDLMGLIDIDTMNKAREELDKMNEDIILYGEGWYMDNTNRTRDVYLCNQNNSRFTDQLGFFCDTIRTGIRGGNDENSRGFVQGNNSSDETIAYSAKGYAIWSENEPYQLINYVSCHDNFTLWDKLYVAGKNESEENLIKQNKLAAAIVQTSQGTPFFLQGEEFLRTKEDSSGKKYENTYNAPDSVNMLDYSRLEEYGDVTEYYRGLIQFRKHHPSLRMFRKSLVDQKFHWLENREIYRNGVIAYQLDKVDGEVADNIVVIYNANKWQETVNLPEGEWKVCVNGSKAGIEPIDTVRGSISVSPISCYVLVKGETKDPSIR